MHSASYEPDQVALTRAAYARLRKRLTRRERVRDRVVIVGAHPDDETIGAAALLRRCDDAHVVCVSPGVPRDRRLWPAPARSRSARHYAALRRGEMLAALARAGLGFQRIHELGVRDQEVASALPTLIPQLRRTLAALRPAFVIAHAYEGGHPDHDATAVAVHLACAQLARSSRAARAPIVLEMTSYHASETGWVWGRFLQSRPEDELLLRLLPAEQRRKRSMLARYRSQREVLAHAPLDAERFRIAPAYDFRRAPARVLLYERQGWATREEVLTRLRVVLP